MKNTQTFTRIPVLLICTATVILYAFSACGSSETKPKPEASWQRQAKFNTFLAAAMTQPLDTARRALDTLLAHYAGDSATMHQLVDFLTPPLSDPNSRVRNEELYIPLLEAIVVSPFYDSTAKIRPQFQLDMARKNRVGHPATDFVYTLADGRTGTLYGVQAHYTLLYINNPDCTNCREVKAQLIASAFIEEAIHSGKLKVVGIYPDEELGVWRKHLVETPAEWINGYDATLAIRKGELYDLRAIPSMYLLDADKRVLLKDVSLVESLEQYLFANQ